MSEVDVIDLAQKFQNDGVSAIVYTDISRDGMMQGVNVEATQRLAQAVDIPIIASGGVTDIEDIKKLCEVDDPRLLGAITGRAIYEKTLDLSQAQQLADQLIAAKG